MNALLFEPMNEITENLLKGEITETIGRDEPRAQNPQVFVTAMEELNTYKIDVAFKMINVPETINVTILLSRVR